MRISLGMQRWLKKFYQYSLISGLSSANRTGLNRIITVEFTGAGTDLQT